MLSYVFELSVSSLEEVAPLALVSKLFNACVKRPNVLGRLELETYGRLKRLLPDLENRGDNEGLRRQAAKAAASDVLLATLQQVRQGYPAIGRIDLGESYSRIGYTTEEHMRLMPSFPSLRSVSLARCVSVTDISPLHSLTSLTKLNLDGCKSILEAGFACLSSLTSLQQLDLGSTKINDEALARLSRSLTALTKLNLDDCSRISGSGFACLSSLTSLESLVLRSTYQKTKIDDKSLAGLSSTLTALTVLNLEKCRKISRLGFACLSSLTSLQKLDLESTKINDEALARLSSTLTALTELNLNCCFSIPGPGFACLSSLTSLESLVLQKTKIDDESLTGLSSTLTALTSLDLCHCESISGPRFACLSSLTSLQELHVAETAINDEGLAGMSRTLPALTELGLQGCAFILEAGFACLSSLTSLQLLLVDGTAINDEFSVANELRRSMPAVVIRPDQY